MKILRCLLCDREIFQGWLCDDCFFKLKKLQCLERLELSCAPVFILFFYTDEIRLLIRRMKYREERYLSVFFAELVVQFIKVNDLHLEEVSHLPMHLFKKWVRGYDQAQDLAVEVARRLHCPHRVLLKRKRWTPPLYSLDASQRKALLKGAFVAKKAPEDRVMMILDDVLTTGSSLEAAGEALFAAGVENFFFLVLAKSWLRS